MDTKNHNQTKKKLEFMNEASWLLLLETRLHVGGTASLFSMHLKKIIIPKSIGKQSNKQDCFFGFFFHLETIFDFEMEWKYY